MLVQWCSRLIIGCLILKRQLCRILLSAARALIPLGSLFYWQLVAIFLFYLQSQSPAVIEPLSAFARARNASLRRALWRRCKRS